MRYDWIRGRRFLLAAVGLTALLLIAAAPSFASSGPSWRIASISNSDAIPGEEGFEYLVQITNVGDSSINGEKITLTAQLPTGMTAESARLWYEPDGDLFEFNFLPCTAVDGSTAAGATAIKCESETSVPRYGFQLLRLKVKIDGGALPGANLTSSFAVEGGGASSAHTVDATRVSAGPPPFDVAAFDEGISNAAGEAFTQAAGHPDSQSISVELTTHTKPVPQGGTGWPIEPVKDIRAELPAGFVGNPTAADHCTVEQLANPISQPGAAPMCSPESQVGTAFLAINSLPLFRPDFGPVPLFNMVPPPGVPARLGVNVLGTLVLIDVAPRTDGDYGISTVTSDISEALPLAASTVTLWGVPASPAHELERNCPGLGSVFFGASSCPSDAQPASFLRNPTACTATSETGLPSHLHIDSWFQPGALNPDGSANLSDPAWKSATSVSHQAPGYPYAPEDWGEEAGITGCESVPFEPTMSAQPTTDKPDSPSGLEVDLSVPQECWEAKEPAPGETVEEAVEAIGNEICQSDLKDAKLTLPAGMSVNPSSAGGLAACTPEEVGLITPVGQSSPIHFDEEPAACPNASKIGTVSIETPLLKEPLSGAVYLAKQGQNPFGSLLAMYLVAEGSGVVIKQAGKIEADQKTGQLTTVFSEAPQLPFSDLHVSLFAGSRAALRTPPTCGVYTTEATLTPWSGNVPAEEGSSFQITEGCGGGFSPHLSAGTENPLAGHTSPFLLRLSREDGEGELSKIDATLPPGLSGYLRGIPYCPDSALASVSETEGTGVAQEANPSCPALSRVGTVTVGAGAGSNPFYTQSGRAYLAGPYEGAPLSLAVIAPAVAGPFDLGSVLVRNALQVNPETAQITAVSDPLPSILHGVPLDLRDVRVELNRPNFTLNPTGCDPMAVSATVTSTQGQSASPSERFQAADCNRLAFKPKLTLTLKGKTSRRAHPALRAVLTMPARNQANIARAQVTLPHAEFLDQGHIANVCTQVQFKDEGCPSSSILGHATAYSPLLDKPLEGPVYLMSGFGHKLPDLAADLNGQIRILLHGKVDTGPGGGIRNTFEVVPDAPVTKFVLSLKGGAKGLIQNSEDVCAHPLHASARFDAHNGKVDDLHPLIRTGCGGKGRRGGRHH